MKMWAGRFRQPLDPEFERWQRSFPFDRQLLAEEVAASKAHARALKQAGVLSAAEFVSVIGALEQVASGATEDESAEDVHHFVEKRLVELIGETGYKLHTGRSRNEQIATDLRLFVRAQCSFLRSMLVSLSDAILQQAKNAGDASMPSYTHLQRAEPVLVAHWLLAYVEMFLRDASRLKSCAERLNVCPLGSGAIAGATLSLDRELMASELGFSSPTANSIDATSDRDFALEFVQVLSLLAVHLSRLAEEFILFSTQEYAFVRLPESYSTGSSAMPQKQNPDSLELIRGKSARVIAASTSLLIALKGLPLAYNKDMQETQEPVFDAAASVTGMLRVASGFMRDVSFNFERMQAAAESGFMNAMAAATYLVKKGVPFRRAHEHIGKAVRLCVEKGCELQNLSLEEFRAIAPEFDADVYEHLTLKAVLECHDVPGGTAPSRVTSALAETASKLKSLQEELHARAQSHTS